MANACTNVYVDGYDYISDNINTLGDEFLAYRIANNNNYRLEKCSFIALREGAVITDDPDKYVEKGVYQLIDGDWVEGCFYIPKEGRAITMVSIVVPDEPGEPGDPGPTDPTDPSTITVTYKQFGARLDGTTDDTEAILKTHQYANAVYEQGYTNVRVESHEGVIFMQNPSSIPVMTDVDLSGSVIRLTDGNAGSSASNPVWYKIVNEEEAVSFNFTDTQKGQLLEGTSYFTPGSLDIPSNSVIKLKETNYYYRKNIPYDRAEMMVHDVDGICTGALIEGWTTAGGRTAASGSGQTQFTSKYEKIPSRRLTFVGCQVDVELTGSGGKKATVLTVERHNSTVRDFTVVPKGTSMENSSGRDAVLVIKDAYNVLMENVNGFNPAGKINDVFGYMIGIEGGMRITVRNCRLNGYWGATDGCNCKDIHYENVEANRIDIHSYFRDLFVDGCTIYNRNVSIGPGKGIASVTNSAFYYQTVPGYNHPCDVVQLNASYKDLFSGLLVMENISVYAKEGDTTSSDVRLINTEFRIKPSNQERDANSLSNAPVKLPQVRAKDIDITTNHPLVEVVFYYFEGATPSGAVFQNMELSSFTNITTNAEVIRLVEEHLWDVADISGDSVICVRNVPNLNTDMPTWFSNTDTSVMPVVVGDEGLPIGGTEGQVLAKSSDGNFKLEWVDMTAEAALPEGGTEGQVLAKASDDDGDVAWVSMGSPSISVDEGDDEDVYKLVITNADGSEFVTPNLKGADGLDGMDGQDGSDGVDGINGVDGKDGADGVSASVLVDTTAPEGEYKLKINSVAGEIITPNLKGADGADGQDGTNGVNGTDGVSAYVAVDTSAPEGEYKLVVTSAGGTIVTPNLKGSDGSDGQDGTDGVNGSNGVSASVAVDTAAPEGEYRLIVTSASGTITTPNLRGTDGVDGQDGANGQDGTDGVNGSNGVSASVSVDATAPEGEYKLIVTSAAGTIVTPNLKGAKGDEGQKGDKGDTGEKGDKGDTGDTGAVGAQGPEGPAGATGPQGEAGPGVAAGGTAGQILKKASGVDYDTHWVAADYVPLSGTAALSGNILPSSTGAVSLGNVSYKYAHVYADLFHGDLSGNASTANSADTADIASTSITVRNDKDNSTGLRIWKGTLTDYHDIVLKDSNTLYFIIEGSSGPTGVVNKPVISNAIRDSSGYLVASWSGFAVSGGSDSCMITQIAVVSNGNRVVTDFSGQVTGISVANAISVSAGDLLQVRYCGTNLGWSDWSNYHTINELEGYVAAPTVTEAWFELLPDDTGDFFSPGASWSAFETVNGTDTCVETELIVSANGFEVFHYTADGDFNGFSPEDRFFQVYTSSASDCVIKVRYRGANLGWGAWSEEKTFEI